MSVRIPREACRWKGLSDSSDFLSYLCPSHPRLEANGSRNGTGGPPSAKPRGEVRWAVRTKFTQVSLAWLSVTSFLQDRGKRKRLQDPGPPVREHTRTSTRYNKQDPRHQRSVLLFT